MKDRAQFWEGPQSSSEEDRLEKDLERANKDIRKYRAQYEKLREGLQAIIDKANRDKAKVKVIYLEELLIGQDFVDGYSAQHK